MSTSDVDDLCENLEGCKLDAEKKISDEALFKQPPPKEDCPICYLRMPSLLTGSKYQSCCGKVICSGCIHAPVYDNQGNEVDNKKCPFCRTPPPITDEEVIESMKIRVEAGDAEAMHNIGVYYYYGKYGYPQNYTKALESFHRASELGFADDFCNIGSAYGNGRGVEVDKKKANIITN